jgi:hypothetical protein
MKAFYHISERGRIKTVQLYGGTSFVYKRN